MTMDAAASVALQYERMGDDVVLRRTAGTPEQSSKAFVTSIDAELLGGSFLSASHRITFPTAVGALEEGNEVDHAGATYRVLRASRRFGDGHESEAPLIELRV